MPDGSPCNLVQGCRINIPNQKNEIRVKFDSVKNCLAGLPASPDCWVEVECALWLRGCLNAEPVHKWYAETKMEKAKEANAAAVALFKAKRRLDAFRKFR